DNIEKVNVNSTTAGVYKLIVSHKGNLTGAEQDFSIIVSGAGTVMDQLGDLSVTKNTFTNLKLYPNPSEDVINLTGDLNELNGADIQIYDMSGRQVYVGHNLFNNNTEIINVANLKGGIYLIDLSNNGLRQIIKFIKK